MFDGLSSTWSWGLGTIVFLLALTLLYAVGLWCVHVCHARDPQVPTIRWYHMACFVAAVLIAAGLLLTPINTIARTQLFSVHMAQAVILTTVCAPLILAACPDVMLQLLLGLPVVRQVVRTLTQPIIASLLFNLTFLLWHTPLLYADAMANSSLYEAMMLGIFFTSLLNWSPLIGASEEMHTMGYPLQMAYAFFDGQPVDIFAFILVFSGATMYPFYAIPAQMHLSGFADQTVAGALLMIPGFVDLGVMTPLFFKWLGRIEEKTRLADEKRQAQREMEWEEYEEGEEEEVATKGMQQYS